LSDVALRWRAVWEAGAGAALDGVASLHASGLRGFTTDVVDVSVPPGRQAARIAGVRVHHLRRADPGELVGVGVPRVRAALAAVRAAHWASSDRQAALILCMVVQQRLVAGDRLLSLVDPVPGRSRRAFVARVVEDVADGVHALGELDFAWLCRRHGLPEPERQVVRAGPRGRTYLDVRWRDRPLVVEIDGAQHQQGLAVAEDHLRRNALALAGEVVLAIDLVGLRLRTEEFMAQVVAAHAGLAQRAARSA
jgi:very-short-patch-repair endonuclease